MTVRIKYRGWTVFLNGLEHLFPWCMTAADWAQSGGD